MPAAALDNPFAKQQKMLMYILPLFFAISGVNFPIGVLLYWLTTNVWSMGQQFLVINRMHPTPATGNAPAASPAGAPALRKANPVKPAKGAKSTAADKPSAPQLSGQASPTGQGAGGSPRPPGRQQPRRKSKKNRRGRRR